MGERPQTRQIKQFIIDQVREHPADIGRLVATTFGVSRQSANRHLADLVDENVLRPTGKTRARRYELQPIAEIEQGIEISQHTEEDAVWSEVVRPVLEGVPKNVRDICQYGFTEILNNVVDHSESDRAIITCLYTADSVTLKVIDFGVGIFAKIKRDIGLADERETILELAKGKLTTDPIRHTGEGIFFTSRVFDVFSILSGALFFQHHQPDDDWLLEDRTRCAKGTYVSMNIPLKSQRTLRSVFDEYTVSPEKQTFSRNARSNRSSRIQAR